MRHGYKLSCCVSKLCWDGAHKVARTAKCMRRGHVGSEKGNESYEQLVEKNLIVSIRFFQKGVGT